MPPKPEDVSDEEIESKIKYIFHLIVLYIMFVWDQSVTKTVDT